MFLVEIMIQTYYLRVRGATYPETFYGFTRSATESMLTKDGKKVQFFKQLGFKYVFISVFFETVLPYLKQKIGKWQTEKEW